MRELERAIERLGGVVYAESSEGIKKGRAVILPSRYRQKQWGGIEHLSEGRVDIKRHIMFCKSELLELSDYGCRIYSGNEKYVLIWKDENTYRTGAYTKACIRRITEE